MGTRSEIGGEAQSEMEGYSKKWRGKVRNQRAKRKTGGAVRDVGHGERWGARKDGGHGPIRVPSQR